jgi:hypothetical protein
MSATATATPRPSLVPREDGERGHRLRVFWAWIISVTFIAAIGIYGFDYYIRHPEERPLSPKHVLLRPNGAIGLKLGIIGAILFLILFLYPLRKHWSWFGKFGNSRHWLDFHVILGTTGAATIAFHSAFKFTNIAGMAFWSMLAVTISGFIGRYLYSQIPRNLSTAELSLKGMQNMENRMRQELARQKLTFSWRMEALYDLPDAATIAHTPLFAVLIWMLFIDFKRPFQVSLLRLQVSGFSSWLTSYLGMCPTSDRKLEYAIMVARQQAIMSKRILFLSRAQQIFQLWHYVHGPFSYAFAFLALLHIGFVLLMGYRL